MLLFKAIRYQPSFLMSDGDDENDCHIQTMKKAEEGGEQFQQYAVSELFGLIKAIIY